MRPPWGPRVGVSGSGLASEAPGSEPGGLGERWGGRSEARSALCLFTSWRNSQPWNSKAVRWPVRGPERDPGSRHRGSVTGGSGGVAVWSRNQDQSRSSRRHFACRAPRTFHAEWDREIRAGRPVTVPCRKCAGCRARARWMFTTSFVDAATAIGGWVCVLTFTLPRSTFDAPGDGFLLLQRCLDLYLKRLRHHAKWKARVRVFESGKHEFPHCMVSMFGWPYVHRGKLLKTWAAVVFEVTGATVPYGQGCHVGKAVSAGESGRIASYAVKEMAAYMAKETRPTWLPAGRRRWSKTPGLPVYLHSRPRHSWPPLTPARDSGAEAARSVDGLERLRGQTQQAACAGAERSPPVTLF